MTSDRETSRSTPQSPSDKDAEEALLGSVLINPDGHSLATEIISREDFYYQRSKMIWDAVNLVVAEKGENGLDIITIADALRSLGYYDEVGGDSYITSLITRAPNSMNVEAYARIIEGHSIRRRMLATANGIAKLAYDTKQPIDKVVADADALMETRPAPSKSTYLSAPDAADRLLEKINLGQPPSVPTALPNRSKTFGGYPKKKVTMLNADSSLGKTALVLQDCEALNFAGRRSLYATLEESEEDMVARRVFSQAGVSVVNWLNNSLMPNEKVRLTQQVEAYKANHKYIFFDNKCRTIQALERSIRQTRPELVVVDDLRHMRPPSGSSNSNDAARLIDTVVHLKDLAQDNNCAMVIIHHLSVEEAQKLWLSNPNRPKSNIPPSLDSITWAKDLRFTIDVWLTLVPDYQADITSDYFKIIEWVMKLKVGQRLNSIELYYDKVKQWFDDNSTRKTSQYPSLKLAP